MWNNWEDKMNIPRDIYVKMEELKRFGGLKIWTLRVLEDGPKNGVDIMNDIQKHCEKMHKMHSEFVNPVMGDKHYQHLRKRMKFGPRRLSPNAVYPLLKKMIDEDLIIKLEDGRYELTEKGQKNVHNMFKKCSTQEKSVNQEVESTLNEIDSYVSYLEDLKKEKSVQHEEMAEELIQRLKKIKELFHEE